jgi:hypothetical protein
MPSPEAFRNLTSRLAERLEKKDPQSAAVKVLAHLERLEKSAQALDTLRQSRNPLNTVEHHARIVGRGARRLQAENQRISRTINDLVGEGYKSLAAQIDQRCNLTHSDYAAEVRAAFRSMSDTERSAALTEALKAGDGPLIAAVCRCPAILSGLSSDRQQHYIQTLQKMKAPDLLEEMDDLGEALSVAEACSQCANVMFNKNYDSEQQSRIDDAERKAAEAEKQLQEILS